MSNGSENKKAALANEESTVASSRDRLPLLHASKQSAQTPIIALVAQLRAQLANRRGDAQ